MTSYKTGDVWPTKSGVFVEILHKIPNSQKVIIKFLDDHGFTCEVYTSSVYRGNVKNPYQKTASGVGFIGVGEHTSHMGDFKLEQRVWHGILRRCYDQKTQESRPHYKGASVSAEWHDFGKFIDWTRTAIGWGNSGWEVDKDLLVRGNKVYGPSTCCVLPAVINAALRTQPKVHSDTPVGVFKRGNSYRAAMFDGQRSYIKSFGSESEAFACYKEMKEARLKELANLYKGSISEQAYQALLSWEI